MGSEEIQRREEAEVKAKIREENQHEPNEEKSAKSMRAPQGKGRNACARNKD